MQHLLTIDGLSSQRFLDFLRLATTLKQRRSQGITEHALRGKSLAMFFEKPSLRTRLSFEQAMVELGGHATYIKGEEVGIGSRESLPDVARVLGRYVQGIMARVFKHETVVGLAQWSGVPVVNGLCDRHHPCQALGDFLTIQEHLGTVAGLRIVFIGDGNNVARSLAHSCIHAGSEFILACPPKYGFTNEDQASFGVAWGRQVQMIHTPEAAVSGANVLYTDVWTSMGQEAERAQRLQDFQGFQINEALIAAAGNAKIMHCLPAKRGEEITDGAMEHAASIVFDQAENRMHAQKAVLRVLMAADGETILKAR
jgi:ornithine carbamoyltransferase